jgi:hypothetical protein
MGLTDAPTVEHDLIARLEVGVAAVLDRPGQVDPGTMGNWRTIGPLPVIARPSL